jgi:hypothetical protein
METEFEIVKRLGAQEQELKLDAGEVHTALKAAKVEEERLRELVEVYGQGQERAPLEETRQHIAVLEEAGAKVEEALAKVRAEAGAITTRAALLNRLRHTHLLTDAQTDKLKAKLEAGTPEREVRALAAKWEPANRRGAVGIAEAPPEEPQAAYFRQTAHTIAQSYGLSDVAEARLLSSLKSGALTTDEARDMARQMYVSNIAGGGGTPGAASTDVSW